MKISFYLPRVYLKPGGGAKVVLEYANYLHEHNHDVSIYYYMYGNYGGPDSLVGIRGKIRFLFTTAEKVLSETFGAKIWFPLSKGIEQHVISSPNEIKDTDIIVVTAAQLVKPIRLKNNAVCVYLIQGYETWQFTEHELKEIYNLVDHKIVVSKWLKSKIDSISQKKTVLIQNGIDTSIFKDYGRKREHYSIVFHYRSAKIKGCEYAIRVIEKLYKENQSIKVYVVSRERRHPSLPECCEYLYNLNPKQVADVNNRCKIFMCTTIEEGFGLPGLEAMACGCALVTTNYEAVYDYAINNVNAMISPICDVDTMVNNIERLFEDDEYYRYIVINGVNTGHQRSKNSSMNQFEQKMIGYLKETSDEYKG